MLIIIIIIIIVVFINICVLLAKIHLLQIYGAVRISLEAPNAGMHDESYFFTL